MVPVRMTHPESTHQDLAYLFNFTFMFVILWLRFAHTYQDLISTKTEALFMVDAILQFPGSKKKITTTNKQNLAHN